MVPNRGVFSNTLLKTGTNDRMVMIVNLWKISSQSVCFFFYFFSCILPLSSMIHDEF